MKDRAIEIADLIRAGNVTPEILREAANLLDPPKHPCNGERVEFVGSGGDVSVGYAYSYGVGRCRAGRYHLAAFCWTDIKSYRVIREAREFVRNPKEWPKDAAIIDMAGQYYDDCNCEIDFETEKIITRAEAEEIWRELSK
jgi:hypothetical protein